MLKVKFLISIENELFSDRETVDDRTSFLDKSYKKLIKKNNTFLPSKEENTISNQYLDETKFISYSRKIELVGVIENLKNKSNSVICITGKAFEYFLKHYRDENNLKNKFIKEKERLKSVSISDNDDKYKNLFNQLGDLLIEKCKIFSRMQPNNKVDLINFLKEKTNSIVGMCGDGANDCGALITSDVGISISHKKYQNRITAHFYSDNDSIKCIEIILRNGRACFENSVIIFKFLILNSIIQSSSILLLFSIGSSDYSRNQYLYIDLFATLFTSLFTSKYFNFKNRTGACQILKKDSLNNSILGKNFLFSIIGQSCIQIVSQIVFFIYFLEKRINIVIVSFSNYLQKENSADLKNNVSLQGSVKII